MKRLFILSLLASLVFLFSQYAHAITVGVEINDYTPTDQDTILGSAVVPGLADNDQVTYSSDTGMKIFVEGPNWRLSLLNLEYTGDYAAGARGGNYYVALDHPSATYGGYNSVAADTTIDLRVIDLDYLIPVTTSGPANIVAKFGVRQVSYEHDLEARYDGSAQLVTQNEKNDLFGVRAGMDLRIPLALNDNLSLVGNFAVSLLTGDSEFTHTESLGNLSRDVTWSSTVPAFDASFGIDYKINFAPRKLHVWFGYDMLRFEDISTSQTFTDATSLGSQEQTGNAAGFEGWKLGVSVEF